MLSLFVFILICFCAAALGGFITRGSVKTWYKTIRKPSWNPPDWVFAPVWSTLYLMMAISGWRIWEKAASVDVRYAISLFSIQLLLNIGWSAVFFGMRSIAGALVEIVFLWIAIVLTMTTFLNIDMLAGLLFLPYLLWSSFAAFLNFTIWRLNSRSSA